MFEGVEGSVIKEFEASRILVSLEEDDFVRLEVDLELKESLMKDFTGLQG
jgi:hypothetical protein